MSIRRIICDTNVWYNGNFQKVKDKGINLIGTYNSLWEICYGTKIFNNPEETLMAYYNFLSCSKNAIKYSPWSYISIQQTGLVDFNSIDFEDMINFITEMVYGNSIEYLDEFNNVVCNKNNKLTAMVSDFKKMKSKTNYKKMRYESYKIENENLIRAYINGIVDNYIGQKLIFNKESWTKFHLFLECFNFFIYEFAKGARKITNNDLPDLLNLIYVGPNDKYLTFEKNGISRIIREAGCGSYLVYEDSFKN